MIGRSNTKHTMTDQKAREEGDGSVLSHRTNHHSQTHTHTHIYIYIYTQNVSW